MCVCFPALSKRTLLTVARSGSWVLRHLVVQHPEYHLVCASALLLFKLLSELMTVHRLRSRLACYMLHSHAADTHAQDNLDYSATLRNLANVQDYANFSFHHGDITDPTSVRGALRKYNIDCVLHFAAHSHVDLSFGNSFTFTHTNTFGTHVLLEASKEAAVGLFLHVSTDEVYGEVADGAADLLETAILAPTNPYAASKACAEMLVNAYRKSFKLPVVIVRSNNVYGPQQYPEKVRCLSSFRYVA